MCLDPQVHVGARVLHRGYNFLELLDLQQLLLLSVNSIV